MDEATCKRGLICRTPIKYMTHSDAQSCTVARTHHLMRLAFERVNEVAKEAPSFKVPLLFTWIL